jgi:hypothetical protein
VATFVKKLQQPELVASSAVKLDELLGQFIRNILDGDEGYAVDSTFWGGKPDQAIKPGGSLYDRLIVTQDLLIEAMLAAEKAALKAEAEAAAKAAAEATAPAISAAGVGRLHIVAPSTLFGGSDQSPSHSRAERRPSQGSFADDAASTSGAEEGAKLIGKRKLLGTFFGVGTARRRSSSGGSPPELGTPVGGTSHSLLTGSGLHGSSNTGYAAEAYSMAVGTDMQDAADKEHGTTPDHPGALADFLQGSVRPDGVSHHLGSGRR